ncbi:MAG: Gfo/Idh/MocA family oxidoreductase [Bacteroides sp.]|nr:Gfo/Idh/MocA family oxidoreductase [Bacteroides sp.]
MDIKVGILGLGGIARKMADTVNRTEGAVLYAAASRSAEKAENFAKDFGAEKAYGSYEEMAEDGAVDLIYIATPHAFHAENALMCLGHGKHVLVEKPLAANAEQALKVFALAKEKGLFAGEAMWSRYQPIRKKLDEIIKSGAIGEVTCVTAFTGGAMTGVKRLTEPELAGGALLDVGIYPLNFASMIIDEPVVRVDTSAVLSGKGVDLQNSFVLSYGSGKMAVLGSSMVSEMDSRGVVYGTEGRIEAEFIIDIVKLTVYGGKGAEVIQRPPQITGFEYELTSAIRAIEAGKIQPDEMPHSETVKMMRIMDGLRSRWGVVYPFEK